MRATAQINDPTSQLRGERPNSLFAILSAAVSVVDATTGPRHDDDVVLVQDRFVLSPTRDVAERIGAHHKEQPGRNSAVRSRSGRTQQTRNNPAVPRRGRRIARS